MAKINQRTQHILESMIVDKFKEKRNALSSELDAINERNSEIVRENKDKSRESIVRAINKAQEDITKVLKNAGLEIYRRYYGSHFVNLLDDDGELKSNWKEYIRPISNKGKSAKQQSLEEDLEELDTKRRKAMDELVLRASFGCKYNDVMEFINNLEV